MKIIRYSDSQGNIAHAAQQEDGSALVIEGDIFGEHHVTAVSYTHLDVYKRQLCPMALP